MWVTSAHQKVEDFWGRLGYPRHLAEDPLPFSSSRERTSWVGVWTSYRHWWSGTHHTDFLSRTFIRTWASPCNISEDSNGTRRPAKGHFESPWHHAGVGSLHILFPVLCQALSQAISQLSTWKWVWCNTQPVYSQESDCFVTLSLKKIMPEASNRT